MADSEQLLLENVKEFLKEADKAKAGKSYNSAATLLFKAIAVACDFHILKTEGFIPKNHTERFRILKSKYYDLYRILDKDFPVYQQSYRIKLNEEYVKVLENDAKQVIKITQIKI